MVMRYTLPLPIAQERSTLSIKLKQNAIYSFKPPDKLFTQYK